MPSFRPHDHAASLDRLAVSREIYPINDAIEALVAEQRPLLHFSPMRVWAVQGVETGTLYSFRTWKQHDEDGGEPYEMGELAFWGPFQKVEGTDNTIRRRVAWEIITGTAAAEFSGPPELVRDEYFIYDGESYELPQPDLLGTLEQPDSEALPGVEVSESLAVITGYQKAKLEHVKLMRSGLVLAHDRPLVYSQN